jgi:MtN3 and saliva related transmembrane protein
MTDIVLFNESNTQLTPEQDKILIDFFGYSSGVLVGITLVPQIIKVFRTKSTKDLSFVFLIISLLAAVFKLIYGVLINQLPIVVTAPIIGTKTIVILIAKCIYDKKNEKQEQKKQQTIEMKEIQYNKV